MAKSNHLDLGKEPIAICIDNIRRRLEAGSLASALTTAVWTDRVLGHSQIVTLPVRTVWLATGNNPTLSDEMLGRTVFIRLDAHLDRPQDRTTFRHPLPRWALEHRAELVQAALILCQSWIMAGSPKGERAKGGFEDWSAVMGGILRHVGVFGFLIERDSDLADPETQAWLVFVRLWWMKFKDEPVGIGHLFPILDLYGAEPIELELGNGTAQSQKSRLGKQLIARRDRQFSVAPDYRLQLVAEKSTKARAHLWKLMLIPHERPKVSVVSESECFSIQN